jgi:hypothetical protein
MNSNKKAHPVESNDTSTHNLLPMSYVLNHLISNFNHLSSNPKGSVSKARRWLKGQLVTCPSKVSFFRKEYTLFIEASMYTRR